MQPANSRENEHRAADRREQDGRAAIGFNKDQSEDGGNDGDWKKNSPFEGVHLALVTVAIPREHDDERDFDDFRRLKGGTRQPDPTAGTVELHSDMRDENQRRQNQRRDENRPGDFFQQLIVQNRHHRTGNETKDAPDHLHLQHVCADFGMSVLVHHHHARAVKHHQPQREETGDAKSQNSDGDSHCNFSKNASRVLARLLRRRRRSRKCRYRQCGRRGRSFNRRRRGGGRSRFPLGRNF